MVLTSVERYILIYKDEFQVILWGIFDSLFLGYIHDCLLKCTKDNIHLFLDIDFTKVNVFQAVFSPDCMNHWCSVYVLRVSTSDKMCLCCEYMRGLLVYKKLIGAFRRMCWTGSHECSCFFLSFNDHSTEFFKVGVRWEIVHKDDI